MKLRSLLFIAAAVLTIAACKKSSDLKTKNGLAYSIVETGSGEMAKPNDYVFFTLKISGDDGKVIQEMKEGPQMPIVKVPENLPEGKNTNPFEEILSKSKIGDHYILNMPVDSIPNLPPNLSSMKYLVYDFNVKDIKNEEGYTKYMETMQAELQLKAAENQKRLPDIEALVANNIKLYKENKLDVKSTDSGIKYFILEQGSGDNAKSGNVVSAQYYGVLESDGTMFDNSLGRGMPFSFTLGVGQVIKGWDEGFTLLNKGTKALLFIPENLGYGEAGSPPAIPSKSNLVFYVELDDIQ